MTYLVYENLKIAVFVTVLLLRRDTTAKVDYQRKNQTWGLFTVSEVSLWPAWWGAWRQAGRHGAGAVA